MEIDRGEEGSRDAPRGEEERADDRTVLVVVMAVGALLGDYGLNAWTNRHAANFCQWYFTHQVVENERASCDTITFGQSRADKGR